MNRDAKVNANGKYLMDFKCKDCNYFWTNAPDIRRAGTGAVSSSEDYLIDVFCPNCDSENYSCACDFYER